MTFFICPLWSNSNAKEMSVGEKQGESRLGKWLTHLPPAIAIHVIFLYDQYCLSNIEGDLVCILCRELVQTPDFLSCGCHDRGDSRRSDTVIPKSEVSSTSSNRSDALCVGVGSLKGAMARNPG